MKIHQKKSGCYRKLTDPHRKVSKSVAPTIQDKNHSDVGHQAGQEERATKAKTGKEGRLERHQELKEKEPRRTEEDDTDKKGADRGDSKESCTGGAKGDSEELEIHIDDSLYEEVNCWLHKTVKEVKEEIANKKREQDIRG